MRSVPPRWIIVLCIIAVGVLRLHLALTRFFDPDEFAYFHWSWLLLHGYQPYRDFFFYILPGFPWLLSPILWLTGDSTNFLIAGRLLLFLVYGTTAAIVYRLSRGSLLAVLIFLTFPVTIDKSVDVRPDMVMLLLYFTGVMVMNPLLSGILFGLSFLIFPKIVFALPAMVYIRSLLAKTQRVTLKKWLAGAGLVGLGFFSYLGVNNLIPQAITSLTSNAQAVTSGKQGFSPLLLLSPYPLIYLTQGGLSLPWVVNTMLWILGAVGFVLILRRDPSMGIFWGLFIGGNILFVLIFPVPYVQYFLPLSVAASVLAGHALVNVNKRSYASLLIGGILIFSFFLQYRDRTQPGARNAEQLQVIRDVLAVTKPSEPLYDMVGSYVFRPDGYFICCHPYGEFIRKLQPQGPALRLGLRESFIATQTKFVVMDRVGFVFWQTPEPDKTFLLTNYLPMRQNKLYSLGQSFRCSQGACVQYALNNQPASSRSTNTFTIPVPETYTVAVEPNGEAVTIDGLAVRTGQTLYLSAEPHRFSALSSVSSFRIQVVR